MNCMYDKDAMEAAVEKFITKRIEVAVDGINKNINQLDIVNVDILEKIWEIRTEMITLCSSLQEELESVTFK